MIRHKVWACALLLWACQDDAKTASKPAEIDPCEGLEAITVSANPPSLRVNGPSTVHAQGGTGRYTYALAENGSGGELRGDRLVAGPTPALDHVTVSDECGNVATLELSVTASFNVAPTRARIRPGTAFQISVSGATGKTTFRGGSLGSGGSISDNGAYTAGSQAGLDLIVVHDQGSGDEVLLQYRVDPNARFRGAPELLALPHGASHKLETSDGTGVTSWTVEGPGSIVDGTFSSNDQERGIALLHGTDTYTGEEAIVRLRILDEVEQTSRPHGRLTDQASLATGDFDGDGIMDAALGVPESDLSKPTGGAVFIFKGSELGLPAQPTWTILGEYDTANMGAVLAAGDLDGDGRDDLAVSEPGADITGSDSGAVLLFKFTDKGPEALRPPLTGLGRGNFGAALAIVDVDGDGDQDLIVGSPGADLAASSSVNNRGLVDVFVLQKGSPIPDFGMVRVGGTDVSADGKFKTTGGLRFGRAVAVADFNGDGRADLASVGTINNSVSAGARAQSAVAIHFGRASSPLFAERPDLYIAPSNPADSNGEGTYRLLVAPARARGEASRLVVTADGFDSPDLSAKGGVKSGGNAGGAYVFDLAGWQAADGVPEQAEQLGRGEAFARMWGDAGGINAGRSAAFLDNDGDGSLELLLGAPYASQVTKVNNRDVTTANVGKVLVYPYDSLQRGDELNKPLDARFGANAQDALGVAVAAFKPGTQSGLLALAARAVTDVGDFTGRLDAFLGTGALSSRSVSACVLPARVASQQRGLAVELFYWGENPASLVGAPGVSGMGKSGDGNELGAGQALLFSASDPRQAHVIHEGASASYPSQGHPAYGGRMVGQDVGVSDFNGDGRPDLIVAAPQLGAPTSSSTEYAANVPACLTSNGQSNGGALVFLGQVDGSYKEGFRLFAPGDIAGCTPADNATCKRRDVARNGLAGGFDFNGDGKQDVLLTRANGMDVMLGRAPTDASLSKPTMACDPAFTLPTLAQGTSMPTSWGDIDGDGCDEIAARYANNDRSGVVVAFGFDPGGARCAGHKEASWLRLSGDPEMGLSNMQLGIASTRAGRLLNDGKSYIAISANLFPLDGVQQPTVLLFDAAELGDLRPAKGELLVGALNDGLSPIPLAPYDRAQGFGRALAGNVDVSGDGIPELVVSAPGAALTGGGTGAVLVFQGGAQLRGKQAPWLSILGDGRERASVGQDLSIVPGRFGWPATLGIGAPLSNRTGTANGTVWLLPIGFAQ